MNQAPIPELPGPGALASGSNTEAVHYLSRLIALYPRRPGESDAEYFAYLLPKLPYD